MPDPRRNPSHPSSQRSRPKRARGAADGPPPTSSPSLAALPMTTTSTRSSNARAPDPPPKDPETLPAEMSIEMRTNAAPATATTSGASPAPAGATPGTAAAGAAPALAPAPSSNSNSNSAAEHRIVRLSEACRQHRLTHARRVDVLEEHGSIPQDCQSSLDSLELILPRLEAEWGTVTSDTTSLVPAICDFYRSVLSGAFCPHAPRLFRLGRNGAPLFSRVHLLLSHVTSRKVVSGCTKVPAHPPTSTDPAPVVASTTTPSPLLEEIVETSSQLLAYATEPSLQRSITDDLINLLMDVHDLNRLCVTVPSDERGPYTAELELLRESRALAASLQPKINPPAPDEDAQQPFVLAVTVGVETIVLELALLQILFRLSGRHRRLSLESVDDRVMLPCQPDRARHLSLGVGRRFHQVGHDLEDLAQLLEDMLARPFPFAGAETGADPPPSAVRRIAVAALRSKMAACDLLQAVAQDASATEGSSSTAMVVSIASAVASTCGRCLQMQNECWESATARVLDDPTVASWFRLYRSRLASLLLRVSPLRLEQRQVSSDPGVHDLSTHRIMYAVLRPLLLDASTYIVPSRALATTRIVPDLEISVLRLLHKAIQVVDGGQAAPVVPALVASRLVHLLDDPILSIPATFLLAKCSDLSLRSFADAADYVQTTSDTPELRKRHVPSLAAISPSKRRRLAERATPSASDGKEGAHAPASSPSDGRPGNFWKDELPLFVATAQNDAYRLLADLVVPPQDETELIPVVVSIMSAIRYLVLDSRPVPSSLVNAATSLAKHVAGRNSEGELARQVACASAFVHSVVRHLPDAVPPALLHSAALSGISFVDKASLIDPELSAHLSIYFDTSILPLAAGVVISVSKMFSIIPEVRRIDLFSPVTTDAESQRCRLEGLCQMVSHESSQDASLPERTVLCLTSIGRDHPSGTVRLLRWQCILWLGISIDPVELRRLLSLDVLREEMRYFLRTAFADPSPTVRDFASRHVDILFREGRHAIATMVTDEGTWQSLRLGTAEGRRSLSASVAARVFSDIDWILHEYCSVPQSQLSFTVGTLSETKRRPDKNPGKLEATTLQFRRSAMRALASMGSFGSIAGGQDRMVFEESLKRVVGLLSSTCALRRFDSIGLGLGALSISIHPAAIRSYVRGECLPTFAPALFRDVLMLASMIGDEPGVEVSFGDSSQLHRESQYLLLSHFIQRFCSESRRGNVFHDSEPIDVLRFVELCLPSVVSQFVVEKDYSPMLLTTGFKLYVLAMNRALEKTRRREVVPDFRLEVLADEVHDDLASIGRKTKKRRSWATDLEGQTRQLCLAPVFIEQILPTIFMKAGRSELTFFVHTVLQHKITLQTILTQREQLILKGLVWEAGRTAATLESGLRAIRAAAVARSSSDADFSDSSRNEVTGAADPFTKASDWVSSHFMYLLVNVVQFNWTGRDNEDRLRAVRCLIVMLHFLKAPDAPTLVPQVMVTVNASIQLRGVDASSIALRIMAVKAFHQFLRIIAAYQWETLGQYLTEIVVSLIPLLPEGGGCDQVQPEESARLAISLLEWLTEASLGEKIAPFFASVPFLPLSTHLDSVRSSLRKNGIDVDSLQVATTQGTQFDSSFRGSHLSDGVSTSSESLNGRRQAALQNRLGMICSLLSNENSNVRCVALKHIASLLRGNRDLFCELVTNESVASVATFLTVVQKKPGKLRGTVTEVMEALLARSILEADQSARVLLAECIGEVGAIDANFLDDDMSISPMGSDMTDDHSVWRASHPPWLSRRVRYEVKLVTTHLVQGLKAAPTSSDQNKIAFCIQQLLVLLDNSVREVEPFNHNLHAKFDGGGKMSDWLRSQLTEAGVIEVVEPFWISEFHEVEGSSQTKLPPYFQKSSTYYSWMSNWCRFMISRAKETQSPWNALFFACRTAVRSTAGLSTCEFLLPLLVLDGLCFGNTQDQHVLIGEMRDALTSSISGPRTMDWTECQKAANAVFTVIDTLLLWAVEEKERRHQVSRKTGSSAIAPASNCEEASGKSWSPDISIVQIDDALQALPLSLRAQAAAKIGMNARALRLVEMAVRESVAEVVFDGADRSNIEFDWKWQRSRAAGSCPGMYLDLMNAILAELQDYETMGALEQNASDPVSSARDSIRFKEAKGDWSGALLDYERALQLSTEGPRDPVVQRGSLRCLLELGQYESVLNQVNGIVSTSNERNDSAVDLVLPMGVEAAWRLGRWDTLTELVSTGDDLQTTPGTIFQQSVGRLMLGIHQKEFRQVVLELHKSRNAMMGLLSSSARESYSRAYEHVVQLHILREVEDVALSLCKGGDVDMREVTAGLGWERRLEFVSSAGMRSIAKSRLALSRLAKDDSMEGSLFLHLGQQARKSRLFDLAATCFAQAEAVLNSSMQRRLEQSNTAKILELQVAKLRHARGESSTALKILSSYDDIESIAGIDEERLASEISRRTSLSSMECHAKLDKQVIRVFVRGALQTTIWMVEGGLRNSSQVISRFQLIHKIAPEWERGHFQYARYIDGLLALRMKALLKRYPHNNAQAGTNDQLVRRRVVDRVCQQYILLAIKHYGEAIKLGMKHVFQALPRLLSLWFDFTSVHVCDVSALEPSGNKSSDRGLQQFVVDANTFMAQNFKQIPAIAFYTAIPQLISRVIHDDKDTAMVVRGILKRVLTKFPAQALWQLGWVRMSRVGERKAIGESIFADAEKALRDAATKEGAKKASSKRIMCNHNLLVASGSLFAHLQKLAQHMPQDATTESIKVAPWRGEVELCEFIPPVQAALSASLGISGNSEPFPRQIPRMKTFCPDVGVMVSKARPKRLKATAVCPFGPNGTASEVGEYHFLVKHEAKGDLRKDARVQDLNNVINRMMSHSSKAGLRQGHRRLHLRTFTVTVLSEDTGLLEWVPMTQSFRNLVGRTYNPQAATSSAKRRGYRAVNFGDLVLRNNFEKAQDMFFKSANLKRAAVLFEELCLKAYPPVLYWWFVRNFADPHCWYEARTRFALSCAAWSGVGHVIGLGDRHSENILVDTTSGACVHVDFDCIFDKGLNLPKPEVIPFRLTQNMLDAFGPTGADGVYSTSLLRTMTTLRENRDTLMSVLEPFVNDPIIDWKRFRSQQKHKVEDRHVKEAKRSILVIDERLQGVYNLVNPNLKRLGALVGRAGGGVVDGGGGSSSNGNDDDLQHMVPLTVEGQVHKMISEATSTENLVQQYVGWMPWV